MKKTHFIDRMLINLVFQVQTSIKQEGVKYQINTKGRKNNINAKKIATPIKDTKTHKKKG
jgi:hypothetical protein